MSYKWYEIGVMLLQEEEEQRLERIQSDFYMDGHRIKCLSMLQHWMSTHPEATWNDLLTALRSPGVDCPNIASDIEKNFTGTYLDYYCIYVCVSV